MSGFWLLRRSPLPDAPFRFAAARPATFFDAETFFCRFFNGRFAAPLFLPLLLPLFAGTLFRRDEVADILFFDFFLDFFEGAIAAVYHRHDVGAWSPQGPRRYAGSQEMVDIPYGMKILVLNSGSSSQKSSLYEITNSIPDDPPVALWEGKIEWQKETAHIEIKRAGKAAQNAQIKISSRQQAIENLLGTLWSSETRSGETQNNQIRTISSPREIDVVGHRVVHGGPSYEEPVRLSPQVKSGIANASVFAPLHNRAELEGMETVEKLLGSVPQIAVFDTGFHRKMPLSAAVYPGPYKWFESGIRRYGFHGINHKYCAIRAAKLLQRDLNSLKIVTCHLGNGCSLAAIHEGRSIDTTMGFTPLEGLMMGTRSGSVDPGILTYLMRQGRLQAQEIDDVLNKESGLLGISGISGDMREILKSMKPGNSQAKLAFDIYIHRLHAGIGAMAAVLGGIDALVFSAGVGENSAEVRAAVCKQLAFLGLDFDESANARGLPDTDIATAQSRLRALIIHAQEDWAIATECWRLLKAASR
jgi:acetate kinase